MNLFRGGDIDSRPRIAAVVVTYFPDEIFVERLEKLLKQIDRVVVVDNGSGSASLQWAEAFKNRDGLTVSRNPINAGIATALNQGIEILGDENYDWVITLDQDSTVADGFVPAMLRTIAAATDANRIALIGANRTDSGMDGGNHLWLRPRKYPPFFERISCDQIGPEGVTLTITSGTATNVIVFRQLGPFMDEYFIDLVDSEYCLRALANNFRVLICCEAVLHHRVGQKKIAKFLGVRLSPLHHSAVRKYYMFRNSVHVIRTYGRLFPHWLLYQILALIEVVISMLLFENDKLTKLKACIFGLYDGLRGRKGLLQRKF